MTPLLFGILTALMFIFLYLGYKAEKRELAIVYFVFSLAFGIFLTFNLFTSGLQEVIGTNTTVTTFYSYDGTGNLINSTNEITNLNNYADRSSISYEYFALIFVLFDFVLFALIFINIFFFKNPEGE